MYIPLDIVRRIRYFCDTTGKVGMDMAFGFEPMCLEVAPRTAELLSGMLRRRIDVNRRFSKCKFVRYIVPIADTTKMIDLLVDRLRAHARLR